MEQVRHALSVASESASCPACAAPCEESRCASCGAARTAGNFRIEKVLAQGPHGRMYLARDANGRAVALKELVFALVPDIQQLEAFEREAKLLATLDHPQIPRFVASFREGAGVHTRLYLAQEFVPGESLLARLEHHRFDAGEAAQLARQVLTLLIYLHGLQPQVLHRDIKPANLILRPDGKLALVDFGSARDLLKAVTHGATLVGTFGYMPPEQLGGTVNTRSDLYALGATLVHLLARRPPSELVNGSLALDFKEHVKVDAHLARFLEKLLAPKLEQRFASAKDALAFLDMPAHRRPVGVRVLVYGALAFAAGLAFLTFNPQTFEFMSWARSYLPHPAPELQGVHTVRISVDRQLGQTSSLDARVLSATRTSGVGADLVTVEVRITNLTSQDEMLSQVMEELRSIHLVDERGHGVHFQNRTLPNQFLPASSSRTIELIFAVNDSGPFTLLVGRGEPVDIPPRP